MDERKEGMQTDSLQQAQAIATRLVLGSLLSHLGKKYPDLTGKIEEDLRSMLQTMEINSKGDHPITPEVRKSAEMLVNSART